MKVFFITIEDVIKYDISHIKRTKRNGSHTVNRHSRIRPE